MATALAQIAQAQQKQSSGAADRSLRSVFVGNIPYEASEEQLKEIFSEVGPVISFRLVFDRETGKPKGYGFCEYKDQETALSAMRNLNGYELNGRALRVDSAASEKNKEEIKSMEMTARPEVSPYGQPVPPEEAPEAITQAVASLPPEQMFELMKQMKVCIQSNPEEARQMLLQNPQLAYALLQAQVVMKIVDPVIAQSILHRPNEMPGAIQPGGAPLQGGPPQGESHGQPGPPALLQQGPPGPPFHGEPRPPPHHDMRGPPDQWVPGPEQRRDNMRGPGMPPDMHGPPDRGRHDRGPPHDHRDFHGPPDGPHGQRMQHHDIRGPDPRGPDFRGPPRDRFGDRDIRGFDSRDPRGGRDPRDERRGPPMDHRDPRGPDRFGPGGPRDPRDRGPPPDRYHGGPNSSPQTHWGPPQGDRGPRGPPSGVPTSGGPPPGHQGLRPSGPNNQGPPGPGPNMPPVSGPSNPAPGGGDLSAQDQEKAALIMQVLSLTDEQIALLPEEQRQSILMLKEQIGRTT
ncbi:cleavage stimulation factor subunit 2 tau variant [Nematostella vectensis]|uniref:cleavage stimulation factor subunit 2 tau variant n=1 Tax=Nematostella vectensis TaxID=45351 RepID=UPI002076EA55|nr:cleavage stimulation factor subunit 2 tau variant [Nematostella vectensis]